jgi:hypothetical protein
VHHRPACLLLTLLAAGCSQSVESIPCPASPVAFLHVQGLLTQVSCAGGAPAAGVNSLFPSTVDFYGTVTFAPGGSTAALCLASPGAEPLVGTRTADQVDVSLTTTGALLSGCDAACAVTVAQRVTGTLQRDPGGAPTGFTGELQDVETLDPAVPGAACGPCATPCQATYALTGLPSPR